MIRADIRIIATPIAVRVQDDVPGRLVPELIQDQVNRERRARDLRGEGAGGGMGGGDDAAIVRRRGGRRGGRPDVDVRVRHDEERRVDVPRELPRRQRSYLRTRPSRGEVDPVFAPAVIAAHPVPPDVVQREDVRSDGQARVGLDHLVPVADVDASAATPPPSASR